MKLKKYKRIVLKDVIKGLIFDVDGTLYNQRLLRSYIVKEIMINFFINPFRTMREISVIYYFRKILEKLRYRDRSIFLKDIQYNLVSDKLAISRHLVEEIVENWIYKKPLQYLYRCKYNGLDNFLHACSKKGLKLGTFSDYESRRKLKAMAIDKFFQVNVSSMDLDVNAFKPNPTGLKVALKKMGLFHGQALYMGDRTIDAVAATRAGVRFVKRGKKGYYISDCRWIFV